MFNNLFAKKEVSVTTEHKYPEIITEIHREFETAGDKLLQESLEIISTCSVTNKDKGRLLAQLGFTNTPQAKELLDVESKENSAKENAELVRYFSRNYPLNKFITENVVGEICKKYNLICGDVSCFKGFVPETKLKIIADFKVKDQDRVVGILVDGQRRILSYVGESDFVKKECWNIHTGGTAAFNSNSDVSKYFSKRINSFFSVGGDYLQIIGNANGSSLKICAPISDMDTKGMDLNGYHLTRHIPDPVVLQPVVGGYLIVCAWGDEASDELVVNQNHN